ncbi:MAG: HD-GYP domain-containing protein [Clostridia bacterium]|nr:HD-GYP domain-containing protein [Clostridia bacterium]
MENVGMIILDINDIPPGSTLASPIYMRGSKLIDKGINISEKIINLMKNWGVAEVKVVVDDSIVLQESKAVSQELHSKLFNEIEMVFKKGLTDGNYSKIKGLIQDLINEIASNGICMAELGKLKLYDLYTYNHSVDVAIMSISAGMILGYSGVKLKNLAIAALLHDIGKIVISPAILNKNGKLDADEYEEIKKHPEMGKAILEQIGGIHTSIIEAVHRHHEWYSGEGYPGRIAGERIPEMARIIAIADACSAMGSKRSYRDPQSTCAIREQLEVCSSTQFDTEIVRIFLLNIIVYVPGKKVKLSDGRDVIVISSGNHPGRPIVREIFSDCNFGEIIDLSDENRLNLTIVPK